jgi:hypothetical protein
MNILNVYQETFLECRVDGRLLNLLTVDDLCYLRVSSLLHHCSIRRGIQVPEQAEKILFCDSQKYLLKTRTIFFLDIMNKVTKSARNCENFSGIFL